jgi:hypothetical protein
LHNLQLAVANPIKQTMGEGGLDKKNVMQLIHSVYNLQDSLEKEVWTMHCEAAMSFLNAHLSTVYVGATEEDQLFASKWEKVKAFRQFQAMDEATMKKTVMTIPAPVLTRWWTAGETASVAWSAYLLLLRVCQQVINANTTASKPNKIASGLQPLLLEAELFSDLAMIHEYHCYFVTAHFGWMQACKDLTKTPGFQAHNTLPHYFLLVEDLLLMKETLTTTHTFVENSRLSLLNMSEEDAEKQKTKFHRFIAIAIEAIDKHFRRWYVDRQEQLRELMPNYDARYKTITAIMRKDHFKFDRVQTLKDNALNKLNKNKRDNALQQKSGVDRTHAPEGLFPYGKLVKRLHFDALKIELLFRGCTEEDIKDWTITQRKNRLRELEMARTNSDGNSNSVALKRLSSRFPELYFKLLKSCCHSVNSLTHTGR